MKKYLFLFCFLFPAILSAGIQVTGKFSSVGTFVAGNVVDQKTGEGISFALIYIKDSHDGVMSDIYGFFRMKTTPGTCTLCVQILGYFKDSAVITIDSAFTTRLSCSLKSMNPDSATMHPSRGNIYGIKFKKNGEIDSIHSSFKSLDSLVAMMNEKPLKKIYFMVGYRYEDGEYEPLNNDELFLRKYLVSKGISKDRIRLENVPHIHIRSMGSETISRSQIEEVTKHHLFHHKEKLKQPKKGKKKIEVYWVDKSGYEVTVDIEDK